MEISQSTEGEKLVFHIKGRADTAGAVEFEKAVMTPIKQGRINVVLNLTDLDYIASGGLRVILMAAKEIKTAQGDLVLCGLQENIRKVFEISGFLSIFTIKDTLQDALA